MKQFTKHTLYVVAVVIAAQLFTSCGSVGLTKMRYNKGYNLEIFTSKKKREKEEKEFLAMREAALKRRAEKQAAQKQRETQNDAEEPTLAMDQPMPVLTPEAVNAGDDNTAAASNVKVADVVKSYAKNKNLRKEVKDVMKKEGISFKDIKKQVKYIKQFQHSPEKADSNGLEVDMILLIILAILIPPLAVYLHEGELNDTFIINLILTILCWLPGVIHALIVISR